ncbi:hypothetical protein SAMN04488077_11133 [Roseovarius tolerans]|jgi:hypothetical protein|uniref:Allene oxide cyclase barrel-like domain-containing protein n=1 Tax=Roseovarius tolerans TaxID=74031 RepID=A0A1H8D8Y5_9RHOB|nr:hypothetical protein [Roseovarius tolerans]SEN03304.1 hypothetical protein SAMN04488077_11133 [Roseovarius tolerans]
MIRLSLVALALASGISLSGTTSASAATGVCAPIGGVAVPNFFAEGEGNPIIISATLTGTVQNAAGKITGQRETATGLEMDMEHYFGRADGGAFLTKDLGILTSVPGKPGRFMLEITYDIQEGTGRGTMEGANGSFSSYGLVDLRDPNNMEGLVRYSGEVCQ